ncbi:hypothetical protein FHS31_002123 [Sphingomonas vulcanisoli]|uniref:Transporter n=1 Tax=Sphingomonas vulcanisoli TaxID=1658060 RepID=A0ABX0TSK6_9SPHN|nr:hypothetical protein [Sphingomonas vulcanisoli]NIJ08506.1 hypothetical protein [Sphingomonas vulcanisoli]
MSKGLILGSTVAVVMLAFGPSAQAGPPYVTDDPQPTDPGKWETYGFASGTVLRRATAGNGGFDINYGGARDLQLSAVVSLAYDHQSGAGARIGIADTELGAKYRFLHQAAGSDLPDVGLFPKIDLPTGGKRFGSGRVGFSIPLWAQKDFGPWSVFGGGGWTYNPGAGNRSYSFEGAALTRQITKRLSLGGEVYHQTADAIDTATSTGLDVGMSLQVAPKWAIIGSGGPMIQHRSAAGKYAFYLALEFHN